MKKETEVNQQLSVKAEIFDWLQSIVFAIIACVMLFLFVARVVMVDGSSMNPTLLHGDRLVISKIGADYQPGDVVVFVAPEFMDEPLVKRVIATEGQLVEIDFNRGKVYVDGVLQDEPYIAEPTEDEQDYDGPIEVPEGCVFVMGDNRNHSTDSRTNKIGCVDTRYILGEAYFVLFPLKSFGPVQTVWEKEEPIVTPIPGEKEVTNG